MRRRGTPLANPALVEPDQVPKRLNVTSSLVEAWRRAAYVTPQEIAAYVPTELDFHLGEALVGGHLTLTELANACGVPPTTIREALASPVRMAYLSGVVQAHFQHRLAMVDAALFQRAMAGDIRAIQLFLERHGKLSKHIQVNHHYSGGVDLKTVSDEELRKLISDVDSRLPKPLQSQPINVQFEVKVDRGPAPGA